MFKEETEIPLVLTVEQVRDILQIGTTSAYDLFNSGVFPVVRIGRQMRVARSEFLKWLVTPTEVAS